MRKLNSKLLYVFCALLFFSAFTSGKKDIITIFMIGDSTMANKSLKNGNIERGWGQMLPEFLIGGGQSCHEWSEFTEFYR